MRLINVAGPPSSGKTSLILRLAEQLPPWKIGVAKFDCLTTNDQEIYEKAGILAAAGIAGKLCPDHFFVTNVQDAFEWGMRKELDLLITESAGLCNRCSPYLSGVGAVCVVDCLSGINTPRKLGPMLRLADVILIAKGDIISQAEREVFAYHVRQMNPGAVIIPVNGITGQGMLFTAKYVRDLSEVETVSGKRLRFNTPSSVCAYCTGERMIGAEYQLGMTRRMEFPE